MRYVDMWLSHQGFSLGACGVVITHQGPAWTHLFCPFTLARGKIPTQRGTRPRPGETLPETALRERPDVPLKRIARIARRRYERDQRLACEARALGMHPTLLSAGSHRKPILAIIQQLEAASRA